MSVIEGPNLPVTPNFSHFSPLKNPNVLFTNDICCLEAAGDIKAECKSTVKQFTWDWIEDKNSQLVFCEGIKKKFKYVYNCWPLYKVVMFFQILAPNYTLPSSSRVKSRWWEEPHIITPFSVQVSKVLNSNWPTSFTTWERSLLPTNRHALWNKRLVICAKLMILFQDLVKPSGV